MHAHKHLRDVEGRIPPRDLYGPSVRFDMDGHIADARLWIQACSLDGTVSSLPSVKMSPAHMAVPSYCCGHGVNSVDCRTTAKCFCSPNSCRSGRRPGCRMAARAPLARYTDAFLGRRRRGRMRVGERGGEYKRRLRSPCRRLQTRRRLHRRPIKTSLLTLHGDVGLLKAPGSSLDEKAIHWRLTLFPTDVIRES